MDNASSTIQASSIERQRALKLRAARKSHLKKIVEKKNVGQISSSVAISARTNSKNHTKFQKAVQKGRLQRLQRARMQFKKAQKKVHAINPVEHVLYGLAIIIALFKDLLDLTIILALPGIGTVITFIIGITLWILITIAGSRETYSRGKKMMMRYGLLIASIIIEGFFFGLNFLPIQTLTMIAVYIMVKRDSKRS